MSQWLPSCSARCTIACLQPSSDDIARQDLKLFGHLLKIAQLQRILESRLLAVLLDNAPEYLTILSNHEILKSMYCDGGKVAGEGEEGSEKLCLHLQAHRQLYQRLHPWGRCG